MDSSRHGPMPGMEAGSSLLAQLRPYVRHCGAAPRPAWHIQARRLLDYLLVFIEKGRGCFVVDGVRYDAEPDDLFWIPPNVVHEMEGYAPGMVCPYVHFDLIYRPEVSHWDFSIPSGMVDLSELQTLMHPPLTDGPIAGLCGWIRTHTNARVGQLMRELVQAEARAQPFVSLEVSGLMLRIVSELLRGQSAGGSLAAHHAVQLERAARYFRDEYSGDATVDEAAALAGLSPAHFRRLFRIHYGCAPRTYLRQVRMQAAKELMIGSTLTLTRIAARTGFETVHAFSRAFRSMEGMAPSAYRSFGKPSIRVDGRDLPYVV